MEKVLLTSEQTVDFSHTKGVEKVTNNEGRRPELFCLYRSLNVAKKQNNCFIYYFVFICL